MATVRRSARARWVASAVVLAALAAAGAGAQDPEATGEAATEPVAAARRSPGEVLRAPVKSIVHPVMAQFLVDAIEEADRTDAALLVIELDTPGGLLTSTREIFTAMLGAETPIVVWVAPSGAQAASAGFFLLMAADVAAMAPGTNTGAAHPVGGQGQEIEGTLGEKVEQDSAATIRSLADRNGRNVELAEAAVVDSRSFTAEEALAEGLVDLVVEDFPGLLREIDGRAVDGGQTTLATAGAVVRTLEMSGMQRFLAVLAHPNIAYMLLTLGGLGLYFELSNPGAILPGVLGAIFLLLAFFGLSVLPVNYAGIALIVLALVLFAVEIKVVSYGLLTVGGVISLVLGSLMLFKSADPAIRVSLSMVGAVTAFAVVVVAVLATLVVRTHRSQVRTGAEGMVHERGVARSALAPGARGKVFVHGELWEAVAEAAVEAGEDVEVVAVDGLRLRVKPSSTPGSA